MERNHGDTKGVLPSRSLAKDKLHESMSLPWIIRLQAPCLCVFESQPRIVCMPHHFPCGPTRRTRAWPDLKTLKVNLGHLWDGHPWSGIHAGALGNFRTHRAFPVSRDHAEDHPQSESCLSLGMVEKPRHYLIKEFTRRWAARETRDSQWQEGRSSPTQTIHHGEKVGGSPPRAAQLSEQRADEDFPIFFLDHR